MCSGVCGTDEVLEELVRELSTAEFLVELQTLLLTLTTALLTLLKNCLVLFIPRSRR